jgi:hypothetical protein
MSGTFVIDDCEVPDLVLETIFKFVAEVAPMRQWGAICAVSKRWRRIAVPVFREAHMALWPKYALPGTTGESDALTFNAELDTVKLGEHRTTGSYVWAFSRALPLSCIVIAGRPIGVVFTVSDSAVV